MASCDPPQASQLDEGWLDFRGHLFCMANLPKNVAGRLLNALVPATGGSSLEMQGDHAAFASERDSTKCTNQINWMVVFKSN